ncbi:MAG: MbnP family protein, partial [Verrucomicrobiota bacterium]|nr:MbnP family protein [Verrucomicrobiota bacterium]
MWLRKLALATVVALKCSLQASALEISFKHLIGDKLIRHNSLRYQNSSAEEYSSTRLSYLVSGFALQSVEGQWIDLEDTIAWIDSIHSRTRYRLDSIPSNK